MQKKRSEANIRCNLKPHYFLLTCVLVGFQVLGGLLPLNSVVFAQDDGTGVTVTTRGNLNVRGEPSTNGILLGTLAANTSVEVSKRYQNEIGEIWLLIPFEGSEAWIAGWLVDVTGELETVPWFRIAPGSEPISLQNLDQLEIVASFSRHDPLNTLRFEWLPDGRIAVGRVGAIEVYTPGGEHVETWDMPPDFETFIVHPSGQWLLYLRQSFMPSGVFSYDIATGEHHYWDQVRLPGWDLAWLPSYAWSEDGSRLLLFNNYSHMTESIYSYQTAVIDAAERSVVGQLDMECNGFVETNHTLRCQYSQQVAYTEYDVQTGKTGESLAASQLASASGIKFNRVGLPIYSDDGSLLFYQGTDLGYTQHLLVANTTTLEPLKRYDGAIFVEALSSDASMAVMREYTGSAEYYVIDPLTGQFLFDLPDSNSVTGEFSPDDAYLAIRYSDPVRSVFQMYDTASGRLLWEMTVPGDTAIATVFSQDGQGLLQGLLDGRLVYRNITSGDTRPIWQKQGISNLFDAMYNLDPFGRLITLGARGQDYDVIYDARSMAEVQRVAFDEDYYSYGAHYSRDGSVVVRYFTDGAALLDVQQGDVLDMLVGHDLDRRSISCFQIFPIDMPQQPFLPIFSDLGIVALPNECEQGVVVWFYAEDDNIALPMTYEPLSLHAQPDGRLIVLGSDRAIHIYDIVSREEIATQTTPYFPVAMLDNDLVVLETPEFEYIFWDMATEQIIGPVLDGQPYLLSPDAYLMLGVAGNEFIVYGIIGDAEPSVAVNWLSASPEERVGIALAEPLLEVMNNPEAEIPPVQVTAWSVMDFSQMPEEFVEFYSNYPVEQAVGEAVPGLENTSFQWMVVPDARVDQFLNVTFPEFIQNLPADGVVRYVNPAGEVVTTTTEAIRELAPQVITEMVGEQKLQEIPETAWNIGESFSTAVMYDSETNVATVYFVSPDVFDPFTGTMSRIYYLSNLSVFTSSPHELLSDPIFSGHLVSSENIPDLSVDVIASPLELELGQKVLGAEFNFQTDVAK